MKIPEHGPQQEQIKNFGAIKDIILEATKHGGQYEIQQIGTEQLSIRFKAKNKHYQLAAEKKLGDLDYIMKKGEPDTQGLQTLYFNCQFPADQIDAFRGEIEINDLRDEEK